MVLPAWRVYNACPCHNYKRVSFCDMLSALDQQLSCLPTCSKCCVRQDRFPEAKPDHASRDCLLQQWQLSLGRMCSQGDMLRMETHTCSLAIPAETCSVNSARHRQLQGQEADKSISCRTWQKLHVQAHLLTEGNLFQQSSGAGGQFSLLQPLGGLAALSQESWLEVLALHAHGVKPAASCSSSSSEVMKVAYAGVNAAGELRRLWQGLMSRQQSWIMLRG